MPPAEKKKFPIVKTGLETFQKKTTQENSPTPARTTSRVGVPVFFSGMFLTLILGIYIGSLLPEIIQQQSNNDSAEINKGIVPLNEMHPDTAAQTGKKAGITSLPEETRNRIEKLKVMAEKDPSVASIWIELGDIYFDANLPLQSIECYGRALAIEPANPDVLTDMGIMYRELGDFKKALECFRNAHTINPNHAPSLYNEGLVLSADLNDKTGAKKAWSRLLEVNPGAISPHGQSVAQMIEDLN